MAYTTTEKALHRIYLKNYFLSCSSMEMEEILMGPKIKDLVVEENVFITGLARSGTTALMRRIFETDEYASLQYSNMPMLLMPNLWKKKLKLEAHERAHKDGIIVDGNSPEEFDEYFWKAFLKDRYIQDGLVPHEVPVQVLKKYLTYIKLICYSKGKTRYISKNNNNILRLGALRRIPEHKIFILFREPFSHASSLMKLHSSFTDSQQEDPFALEYFNFLGHHEFGLGHKPFWLTDAFKKRTAQYSKEQIEYWIAVWINYYQYLLEQGTDGLHLLCFEDLIQHPDVVYSYVSKTIQSNRLVIPESTHSPSSYKALDCEEVLIKEANTLYEKLKAKLPY